jgi:ribonuclease-3 family protein
LKEFDQFIENNDFNFSVKDSKQHSVLVFAFVGDAIFTLFVRTYYTSKSTFKAGKLHTLTSEIVNAHFQAKIYDEIFELLDEEEKRIGTTARNVHTNNIAKNSNLEEYKKSTSFEAILGYLYLTNNQTRLKHILDKCLVIMEKKDEN